MRSVTALWAVSLALLPAAGDACGDKLVPVGGNVRMERITRSSHPGTVYVLSGTQGEAGTAASEELVAGLNRSGHNARIIAGPEQLESARRESAPDIVIAQPGEVAALRARLAAQQATPVVVTVLFKPTRATRDAARREGGCVAEVPDWGVSPALRVVNGIRAEQAAGRPIACVQSGSASS